MKTYTLSELNQEIERSIKRHLPDTYLVTAEISSLQVRGGHCYLELVEKATDSGIFNAKMRAVCWASTYNVLNPYFTNMTGQKLCAGLNVLLEVEISYHSVYGLSLVVVGIDPRYTIGDLQQKRSQVVEQLKREGIYDMNRMLPFPSIIKRVAVVSSADAAGYEDFCNQLRHNTFNFQYQINLFDAIMQGDRAAQSICASLDKIAYSDQLFDVVLITRGGGSSNDLECFNDYLLSSYCAQFPLPIISAIGHTKDISIVDEVANLSLKTPTAAASFLIEHNAQQLDKIQDIEMKLTSIVNNLYTSKIHQLDNYNLKLRNLYAILIEKQYSRVDLIEKIISLHSPMRILKQGYTITLVDEKPITSVSNILSGTQLTTETIDGSIKSIVI